MTWEPEFVGREAELKILIENLNHARNGNGSIIFIRGEAGIGKTRLALELSKQKISFGFEFLTGQCIYHEGTDPYLPFIDMFKKYLSTHPYLASAIQVSFKSPFGELFDFYPIDESRYTTHGTTDTGYKPDRERPPRRPQPPKPDIDYAPELTSKIFDHQMSEGQHRMFETVSKLLIGISKKKPLILFIDDVHWADTASLHLLHYLARNILNQPILILCAYRVEELAQTKGTVDPLQEFIARLGTENLFTAIDLTRLDKKHTTQVISSLLEVKNIPKDFAELIFKETEGNPFFIREVLKTLIEEGALSIQTGKLVLNISPAEIVIPVSIKELINLRVQRLDEVSVDVLEYAAVIGNVFKLELLNNIIDMPESKLVNVLGKLTEHIFITDIQKDEGFTYKFTHNKIHEVIYDGINDVKKKIIHLRLAKYLEDSKIDNLDEVVFDLAYHFYYGLDFDRALSYSIEGGEKAMHAYANKEALDLYNIALNSLRRLDEKLANTAHYKEKKIEVLSQLGALNKSSGDLDKALNYFEQLLPLCDEINDKSKKASAFLEIGWIFQEQKFKMESENYFKKSLVLAEEVGDGLITAGAYIGLGTIFEHDGNYDRALEYYSTSRMYAEKNHDLLNLAKAHNGFGRVYDLQGNFPKAVKHKETSIYIFKQLNDLPELAKAYSSLGLTYLDMGELEKTIEYNKKCIDLADKISDLRLKCYGQTYSVNSLVKADQLDQAENYTTDALEISKKLDERYITALNYINFGIIYRHRQELNKAIFYFRTAIELLEKLNVPFHLAECYEHFAEINLIKGESAKANYYLKKAQEIRESTSIPSDVNHRLERLRELRF